jgi:exodeoxyribonuclease VII small subunit
MPRPKAQTQGFEESLSALEKIVAQLEAGELPLERALEIFEEGVGLARRCQGQLADAERKVELLLREHGELRVVPFDPARSDQSFANAQSPQIKRATEADARARAEDDDDDDADEFDETLGDDPDDDNVPF